MQQTTTQAVAAAALTSSGVIHGQLVPGHIKSHLVQHAAAALPRGVDPDTAGHVDVKPVP